MKKLFLILVLATISVSGDAQIIISQRPGGNGSAGTIVGGTCTNQAITAIDTTGTPTCTTITSGYTSGLQTAITFGTSVQTALGVNIGSAGAVTLFNGALGTPSSLTLTNGTGLPLSTGVTGNLSVNNLNGGTNADSSHYWRGDSTWATVASGGGADFTNAGNPQGSVTAVGGQTCRDTTNGILYVHIPLASSNTGWYRDTAQSETQLTGTPFHWWAPIGNGSLQQFGPTPVSSQGSHGNTSDFRSTGSYESLSITGTNVGWFSSANQWTGAAQDFDMWADILTGASVTNVRMWFGISSTDPSTDTVSGQAIVFRFSDGASDTGWVGVTNNAGTQAVTAAIGTVAATTSYHLRIRRVANTVNFSVNDGAETAATTNVPTNSTTMPLILYFTATSGTKTFEWRQIAGRWGA
jgi:hypothetical protein